jgi:transposase
MGRPLPQELRDRVVGAWKQGKGSVRELAKLFDLGEATVNRWVARYNKTGSTAPLPHAGGQTHRIPDEILPVLEGLVEENPDLTREEYGELLFRETGVKAAICTVGRALKRLGYTRKKKSLVASEQLKERAQRQREEFLDKIAEWSGRRFVFLDEAGTTISMTRGYGWAPRGKRLVAHVPRNRGTVLTMIGALTEDGVAAMMTNVGGTSGEVWEAFVRDHLVPILEPGDVVVLDNLGAHHRKPALALIEEAGAEPLFMPPYSPDLNPIELCWSKLKAILRQVGARTVTALRAAIEDARHAITRGDVAGWFNHCGYAYQLK